MGQKCTKHIQYRQSANTKRHPYGNFVRLPRSGEINWQPLHTRRRNAFQAQCISDSIEFDGEALHNAFDTSHIHFSVVFHAKSTFCQNPSACACAMVAKESIGSPNEVVFKALPASISSYPLYRIENTHQSRFVTFAETVEIQPLLSMLHQLIAYES